MRAVSGGTVTDWRWEVQSSGRHLLTGRFDSNGWSAERYSQQGSKGAAKRVASHPDVGIGV